MLENLAIGATMALAASRVMLAAWAGPSRRSARVQAGTAGVQAEGRGAKPPESVDAAGPKPALAPSQPVPSSPRLWMGADVQMKDFLRWCFRESYHTRKAASGEPDGRYSDEEWFELYLLWAQRQHLQAIPETVFLTQLGKQTHCIKKSRERLKDPETGAVPRNANGTPMRATYYRLFLPAVVAMPVSKRARAGAGGTVRRAAA